MLISFHVDLKLNQRKGRVTFENASKSASKIRSMLMKDV